MDLIGALATNAGGLKVARGNGKAESAAIPEVLPPSTGSATANAVMSTASTVSWQSDHCGFSLLRSCLTSGRSASPESSSRARWRAISAASASPVASLTIARCRCISGFRDPF